MRPVQHLKKPPYFRLSLCVSTLLLGAVGLLLLSGCGLLRAPHRVVTAIVTSPQDAKQRENHALELPLQVRRFMDDFLERNVIALNEYARRVGTEAAQVQVLRFKLYGAASVLSVASGPNPYGNLFDLVTVTVINRMTVKENWTNTTDGEAFRPWLVVSRSLETNVWKLACHFLSPEEVEQLRAGISQCYKDNPEVWTGSFARPSVFASLVRQAREQSSALSGVFSLANLNPTAGLEPAVREATRARLFAERAMFTAQRMSFLLSWQIELLSHEIAAQPAVQLALTNSTKLIDSAEHLSPSAAAVTQVISQLPDRSSTERREIVDALDQQEGKLKELASEVGQMLDSGERMPRALDPAITNLDGLKRLGMGERVAAGFQETNTAPFRVLDYPETAGRIGNMARELNLLITNAQHSAPQFELLSQDAARDARKLIHHGFFLGFILVFVLLVGAVAAGLSYRFLASKMAGLSHGCHDQNRFSSPPHDA